MSKKYEHHKICIESDDKVLKGYIKAHSFEDVLSDAIEIGISYGVYLGKIDIIKNMIINDISDEDIMDITDISEEELLDIYEVLDDEK